MPELRDMDIGFVSLVGSGANQRTFALVKAAAGPSGILRTVAIAKVDTARRLVTGVVLEPRSESDPDTQGDWYNAAEIEKAAHGFMQRHGAGQGWGDVDHDERTRAGEPRESWVTRVDGTLGDQVVKAGSWLMTMYIADDATWSRVAKGEIRAFSIGGTGTRVSKTAAAAIARPVGSTAVAIAKASPTFAEVLAIEGLDRWLPGALDALGRVLTMAVLGDVDATREARVEAARLAIDQFAEQLTEQVAGTVAKRAYPAGWTRGWL